MPDSLKISTTALDNTATNPYKIPQTTPNNNARWERMRRAIKLNKLMAARPRAKAGSQRSNGGEEIPPVGRPKTKIRPTDSGSRPHHNSSSEEMLRPWYQADKGKVSIKDSTKMGWTINKVPKPSAISCRP